MANSDVPYTTTQTSIQMYQFYLYGGLLYRPRQTHKHKEQWTKEKQQDLLDSLFRRAFVPSIVLRELDTTFDDSTYIPLFEILDGEQRITAIQNFFNNKIETPRSLKSCKAFNNEGISVYLDDKPVTTSGYIMGFSPNLKYYVYHLVTINAVIISGIGDKNNEDHEATTAKILQRIHQNK
jgi:hypothetical protein